MSSTIDNLKSNIINAINSNQAFKKMNAWYVSLSKRDTIIVKVLLSLMVVSLLFTWVVQPMKLSYLNAESRLQNELRFHKKLKENAYLFSEKRRLPQQAEGSILTIANNLAKTKGIQLKRFEPDGDKGLRVWMEKVEFNSAIDWLEILEREKGVRVAQLSIDKTDSGIVNIRAVLSL